MTAKSRFTKTLLEELFMSFITTIKYLSLDSQKLPCTRETIYNKLFESIKVNTDKQVQNPICNHFL